MPRRRSTLKVVFDTSVLFTQVASDLIRAEAASLIADNAAHPDLVIEWFLPNVVRCEREYQMRQQALELLPHLQKLEKVLGHNLNITSEIVTNRIATLIASQMQHHRLTSLELDTGVISWSQLIEDATFRRPPFDPQIKEKGFRDALICETFLQLVKTSPRTPSLCSVVLVANDKLIREAIADRTQDDNNVRIFSSIEELREFINTLVSQVTEDFVAQLTETATKYFFTTDDESGLVYREKVTDKLSEKFAAELTLLPQGASSRQNGKWLVSKPRFMRKTGRQIFWATRISREATAYRTESRIFTTDVQAQPIAGAFGATTFPTFESTSGISGFTPSSTTPSEAFANLATLANPLERKIMKKGSSKFEVDWSVHVNQRRKFSSPKIEDLRFIETTWDEPV